MAHNNTVYVGHIEATVRGGSAAQLGRGAERNIVYVGTIQGGTTNLGSGNTFVHTAQ